MRRDRPVVGAAGGVGLTDDAKGLRAFCATCVEAFAGVVSVVKPQVAFFERHGAAGLAELERLIAEATAAGLIVIADAKRGDIDSTAAAYADAWLGEASPLAADAVTVHPYLGLGALAPLIRLGGGQRAGRHRGGPELEPRGPGPPTGRDRRGPRRGGHAPGRDRRAQRLARGARAARSVRSSGPRWSRRISRCPSSEGLSWRPGWGPRGPDPPTSRPVSPDVGPARCCRAAPAGS